MTTEFTQFNLHPQLAQAVSDLGYNQPTPIQSAVIPVMVSGQDVIGQAQTGTGKTAAFALPILHNLEPAQGPAPQALVLAPTRELALQVRDAIAALGRHMSVRVLPVYGGAAYGPQIGQLKRGVDIVVGTPGRLLDLIQRGVLNIQSVRTVVLDEADEMLSMGFIEDMEAILAETPETRQTALFSATMPAEIRRLAERYMNAPQSIAVQREQVTVPAIEQRYYLVNSSEKTAALTRLFEIEDITSALIFVRTRTGTAELANELNTRGYPAEALSGDLSQEAREQTMNRFRQNQIKVLVATDVAARGLDVEGISHVFNFDLPEDPEIYVHRIGRTGRAGKTGIAASLVTPSEKRRLSRIEAFSRSKLQRCQVPTDADITKYREDRLANQVKVWLQRGRCKQERAMIENFVAEGYDPLEIAAAALKLARSQEKQRPISPLSEVIEPTPAARAARAARPARRSGPSDNGGSRYPLSLKESDEPGMVRFNLNKGKVDGIRPNDIVGAIAAHTGIPGHAIGKIYIQERRSLVDIPAELVSQVQSKSSEILFRRQPVKLQKA